MCAIFRTSESWVFALLIVAAPCAAWLRHRDLPWTNVHHGTAYTALCHRFNADDTCITPREAGPTQEFTILTAEQKVLIQTNDGRTIPLERCVVLNSKNWHCTARSAEHKPFPLMRENGVFDTLESPPVTAYTSYMRWRLMR